ncbi:MAG: aminomethyl-transferring glycine dehydrogenase [Alphaproteobacteria bacterium]|nr:aminomethyl-transferring glycine dehydrogenase [Alphaproteobacteria bacterium]
MADKAFTLDDLKLADAFARRHIGPDEKRIEAMLEAVGASSLDDLIEQVTPPSIRSQKPLDLPVAKTEREVLDHLKGMADANEIKTSMIGMGYYGTITPSVILRNVLENPGWYTAYTPYQAEISQGRLEVLLNFQQAVADLTGLELANASLLDEATAAAEAMAMAKRVAKAKSDRFFVDADCHPQTLAVLETRAEAFGFEIVIGDPFEELDASGVFGALLHYPGSSGEVRDFSGVMRALKDAGALSIVATDLLALVILNPPGEMGADIAIGSAQRFGVPMGYGGPHAAFFATREAYKRAMPGRLIGVSVDASGRMAYRMALQTREQHIRREKATSNICTAQVLLAIIASFFAVYHGRGGLRRIARRTHRYTEILAEGLRRRGVEIQNRHFFDTITVSVPGKAKAILAKADSAGINLRLVDGDRLGICCDEITNHESIATLLGVFGTEPVALSEIEELDHDSEPALLSEQCRKDRFLDHPVFTRYRSETEMLRYFRRLQLKDLALDRSMIPLGSCTMKLNASTEMIPITWPGFSDLHPFCPADQADGYQKLFEELEAWLAEITGFDAISLQPNAGSQGEYAGLLTIRAFHKARGEGHRNICIIPSSAHGTNPASAIMAGMNVVVVGSDDSGDIDLDDLRAKAAAHKDDLAALMITYPSTHGVFETTIKDVIDIIHAHGGQVYLDGANMNAMVGIARPAEIGADVCHLNLHKTFCIPHGGGGPGMGPIGVKAHLAPYLPGHAVVDGVNPAAANGTIGQVSAAPWGSPSILPISHAYIAMMGPDGLTKASQVAILNANYVAKKLADHYPIVYTGRNGLVAHECIIDLRDIKQATGIGVEDVAKRMVDYGIHAPTMSWPVPETMMIEPTESESKDELDRFCAAMIGIREEIREVERGQVNAEDSVLRHAPHTADQLTGDWPHAYPKDQAFFPLGRSFEDKYWPPVRRIDNAYGDRHLMCTCPPVDAYMEAAE